VSPEVRKYASDFVCASSRVVKIARDSLGSNPSTISAARARSSAIAASGLKPGTTAKPSRS
jgi:hypothetical protein